MEPAGRVIRVNDDNRVGGGLKAAAEVLARSVAELDDKVGMSRCFVSAIQ
jgi:hypothetical protein